MRKVTLLALVLTLNACSFSDSGKEDVASRNDDLEFAVDTLSDRPDNTEFKVEEQKVANADEFHGDAVDSTIGDVSPDQFSVDEETAMTAPAEPTFSDFKKTEPKEVPVVEVAQVSQVERPVATESKESKEEWRTDSAPVWQPEATPKKAEKKPVHVAKAPVKPVYDDAPAKIEIADSNPSTNYGAMETYRFQKGDTLMMVAFKIYGDYRKWKDLKKWNKGTTITEGVDVKYYVPDQKFGWKPSGLPYMVRTGDTLQIISMDKYKTTRKWKSIYANNRPLIRDPNLIFAGFTIYYRPMRDLASETK